MTDRWPSVRHTPCPYTGLGPLRADREDLLGIALPERVFWVAPSGVASFRVQGTGEEEEPVASPGRNQAQLFPPCPVLPLHVLL